MLGDRPPRSVDEALAIGRAPVRRCWWRSISQARGTPAVAVNARDVIVTDAVFGNASPLMEPTSVKARETLIPLLKQGVLPVVTGFNGATADGTADHAGPRRHRFLGVDSGGRARCRRAVDLDRRGRHHDAPIRAWCRTRRYLEEITYDGSGRAGLQRRQGAASAHAGAAGGTPDSGVEQEQLRAGEAGHEASCPRSTIHRGRAR